MKTSAALFALVLLIPISLAWSHCQVPCGIYDDEMRLEMMGEHIKTIERAMQQISELMESGGHNPNQKVRWVINKDEHADELVDIVTWYFMTQRVKPVPEDSQDYEAYVAKLTILHEMMVNAMKAKQSTDIQYAERLKELLMDFAKAYMGG